jgi:sugar lactone lactonase YvrE
VASDGAGNLFVTDAANYTIRKIVIATGKVTTLAGTAGAAGSDDGTGATARFNFPQGVTSDGAGNLYVTDSGNNTIRRIVIATGKVTTLAGSAPAAGSDDGTGAKARFTAPQGITNDGAGNLFVADSVNNTIRKVVIATGAVTTLTGSAGLTGGSDGTGAKALFNGPGDVASDGAGSLIVADTNNHAIRAVVIASGAVTTLAGSASSAGRDNGPATTARFQAPIGVASDGAGNLLVADSGNHAIRKIVLATQTVSTLAGFAGKAGSDDGTGAAALFDDPQGVASDGADNLFVADSDNHTIRRVVVATGVVTTLAGDPTTPGSDDGAGPAARFNTPLAVVCDGAGNLFVADSGNHTIRKIVIAGGTVTTLAGSAGIAGSADGMAASARFDTPSGLAVDHAGNLFVADTGNRTIRKLVIATAAVSTLAGSVATAGDDDGVGTAARFDTPGALVCDSAGNLFVADSGKNTIRKIHVATQLVTTVVGTSGRWENVLGPLPGEIASPAGLTFLPTGELVLTDRVGNVILAAQF